MTENGQMANDDEMQRRREAVARLRARHLTQREIVRALRELEVPIVCSVSTVNRDLGYLRKQWQERAERSTQEWIAEEIAEIEELEAAGWKARKYDIVLRCKERKAKLLGLDKPQRTELTGAEGGALEVVFREVDNAG